ncbi:GtrA family protein [Candidatus Pantoea floridensis]|uniref:Flippase GtrA (Transmembrane translocase of bactoprenol-linked glucose) n=1 Tax=Candidatus Pantoea floridensis TaxID=1938870 RepID=A0A286BXI8_9GAMM|nr:putative flippase GtrA [Enterobacteriaceae bacterium JKS000233]SOD38869.1 Putative flippase GtrA (transmembrane translocase of bactoprenol-linked glucose) [Pantoea floridensis]
MKLLKAVISSEFLRFALVGGVNTLLHAIILTCLMESVFINVVFANFFAFLIANVFSYFMNCNFTFKVRPGLRGYAKFLSSSLLALILTLAISALVGYMGYHYLIGFLFVILLVPVISYFMMKLWAFRN